MDLENLEEWTAVLQGRISSARIAKRDYHRRKKELEEGITLFQEQLALLEREYQTADETIEEYTLRLQKHTQLIAKIRQSKNGGGGSGPKLAKLSDTPFSRLIKLIKEVRTLAKEAEITEGLPQKFFGSDTKEGGNKNADG